MYAQSLIALVALAGAVQAAPVARDGKPAPAGWWTEGLEDYMTYHTRYLALQCYNHKQANDQFWQSCCSPLLKDESLSSRPAECTPSAADLSSVSASLAQKYGSPTVAASAAAAEETDNYETYCESESSTSVAPTSTANAAASASPAAATASPAAASSAAQKASPAAASASPAVTSAVAPAYVAEAPKSSAAPTSTYTPAPTTASPSPAATTQASSNNGGETFTGGFATYFYQNGNPGACGNYNSDSTPLVAIDQARWGASSFGVQSSTCGKWVTITNTNNGRSVSAIIADVCPTCTNGNSLDLSVGAFTAIASESDGMVPISWHFN